MFLKEISNTRKVAKPQTALATRHTADLVAPMLWECLPYPTPRKSSWNFEIYFVCGISAVNTSQLLQ
jgi:hypothetical protein